MRIGVQRQADLRVPERLHDRARVGALHEQQLRRRVPQVFTNEESFTPPKAHHVSRRSQAGLPLQVVLVIAARENPRIDHRHQWVVREDLQHNSSSWLPVQDLSAPARRPRPSQSAHSRCQSGM